MNATTAPRTADQITNGRWIVRFDATNPPASNTIGGKFWQRISDQGIGTQSALYEMVIVISEANGTTLDSAARIAETSGFADVIPIIGWKMDDDDNNVVDEFRWM